MESSSNNLLEALKQVERRTENSASGWRLLLYFLILSPVGAAAFPMVFAALGFYSPLQTFGSLLLIGLAISGMVLFLSLFFATEQRRVVRKNLEASDLLIRMAALEEDPIFSVAPWPWRLLLPGTRRDGRSTHSCLLHRVAWNLDWYLKPSTRLWRAQWVTTPLLLTVLGLYLGLVVVPTYSFTGGGIQEMLEFGWIEFLIFNWIPLLLLLPLVFLYHRRQIWTEELVRHLRERLLA